MDDRTKAIIQKIEDELKNNGFVRKNILNSKSGGIALAKSYFDALVDLKLEGKDEPKSQEIWEEMKEHINYLSLTLSKAADDYRKLENKVRHLEQDIAELIKKK